jgi:triacylglycerol esterase/lipase EstA (alpha/beta hydrolase family)
VNGSEKVDIVAYSLGGVVSRLAIIDHHLENRVRTLVTMGTPHHGTFPARYVDTVLGRSLRPGSPTIQRLKNSPWPKEVRGVTFWSKNDLLILPPEAAAVEGTSQIDMSPFTHFSYLIDPRSWAAVRSALTD